MNRRNLFRSAIAAVAFAAMDTMGLRALKAPEFDPYDVAYLQLVMRNFEESIADIWDDKNVDDFVIRTNWNQGTEP
jgi:hypothetical protein